jgi:hypothetical protein
MPASNSFRRGARNSIRAIALAGICSSAVLGIAHAQDTDPLYKKGFADRAAWEQWFSSLHGDYKIGAFYWAGQRSLPHPGSCRQMDDDFFNGCTAAKERLAPADALRTTEPEYKAGWNAWTSPAPQAASSDRAASSVSIPTPPPESSAPGVPAPPPSIPAVATAVPPTPEADDRSAEERFIAQINKASAAYNSAPNDMAQGAVRTMRARALCGVLPDGDAHDWTGTIESMSSTNDGRGVLSIRISPHITISTMNNAFSDSLGDQPTLIAVGSPLWSSVVQMKPDQPVVFSGRFSRSNDDCFAETSLTVSGGMSDPDFVMRFYSVSAASKPQ